MPQANEFSRADVFLKVLIEDVNLEAELATNLRQAGLRVEIDLTNRGLKRTLSFASKMKIPIALILGQQELENNQIQIRNLMVEPWTQETIPYELEQLVNYVKEVLKS